MGQRAHRVCLVCGSRWRPHRGHQDRLCPSCGTAYAQDAATQMHNHSGPVWDRNVLARLDAAWRDARHSGLLAPGSPHHPPVIWPEQSRPPAGRTDPPSRTGATLRR